MQTMDIQTITAKAVELADNRVRQMRHIPGTYGRQGDIYLFPVAVDHAHGKRIMEDQPQLALGNSVGSRHILVGNGAQAFDGTTRPGGVENTAFLGPLVKVEAQGATVTHPEHAHVNLEPGCYQVVHQLDARTLERVRD